MSKKKPNYVARRASAAAVVSGVGAGAARLVGNLQGDAYDTWGFKKYVQDPDSGQSFPMEGVIHHVVPGMPLGDAIANAAEFGGKAAVAGAGAYLLGAGVKKVGKIIRNRNLGRQWNDDGEK